MWGLVFCVGLLIGVIVGFCIAIADYDDKIKRHKPMVVDDVVYYAEPCREEEEKS